MYASNGKISKRQIFRLYVFDLMGIATLLLPPYLANLCGADGIWAILLGTGLGFLYLCYLGWCMKRMHADLPSFLQENTGRMTQNTVFATVLLHSVLTAGFCAFLFTDLMQYSLVKETSYEVLLLVILLVSAYAVSGGLESRARVYEVLFWVILIPYVAMMLAALKDFEMIYMDSFFVTDGLSLGKGAYLVFLLLTPLFFAVFLSAEQGKKDSKSMVWTIAGSIVLSAVLLLGSYVILTGNFGSRALSMMRYPVVTLMSTVQFKGNFLKRMDALMLAVWFFTLYALLNLHMHYAAQMCRALFPAKKEKHGPAPLVGVTISVFAVAYALYVTEEGVKLFVNYYSYVAVPILWILPVFGIVCARKTGKERKQADEK